MTDKPFPINGVGMPAALYLCQFGQWIYDAFGETAFHCGSSAESKTWRDVDVRVMFDDEVFDAMFPGYTGAHQSDPKWALICAAISELGRKMTGLPVDFQIQRASDANERYKGIREPLFLCPVKTAGGGE